MYWPVLTCIDLDAAQGKTMPDGTIDGGGLGGFV
eukprot:SAG11_NODE_25378_length_359_cov_1.392308_1_plen_33_part_01